MTPTGGSAVSLAYTGLGQALRITNGAVSQVNDQLGLNEDTGSPNTYFTRDPSGAMLGERRSGSYYFLHDGLGSVVAVTDTSGNVVSTYSYDPYGNATSTTGSLYQPIRYAGGYWDGTSSAGEALYKFGQRYYDPSTGRWTQIDPVDNPLDQHGWNQYDYAGDDPINMVDPSGMCRFHWCDVVHAGLSLAALPAYAVYYASYQGDRVLPGAFAGPEALGLGAEGGSIGSRVTLSITNRSVTKGSAATSCRFTVGR